MITLASDCLLFELANGESEHAIKNACPDWTDDEEPERIM